MAALVPFIAVFVLVTAAVIVRAAALTLTRRSSAGGCRHSTRSSRSRAPLSFCPAGTDVGQRLRLSVCARHWELSVPVCAALGPEMERESVRSVGLSGSVCGMQGALEQLGRDNAAVAQAQAMRALRTDVSDRTQVPPPDPTWTTARASRFDLRPGPPGPGAGGS
eukprot:2575637-Rhodomonas_salina.3